MSAQVLALPTTPLLRAGHEVEVTAGPWAGIRALVTSRSSNGSHLVLNAPDHPACIYAVAAAQLRLLPIGSLARTAFVTAAQGARRCDGPSDDPEDMA